MLTRRPLTQLLDRYEQIWLSQPFEKAQCWHAAQRGSLETMRDFSESHPAVFQRTHAVGHFTGSALVVTPDYHSVLLTLHAKLGKWLQLGGHADGEADLDQVALREAEEEGGLTDLHLVKLFGTEIVPFDLDIHDIPARKTEAAHLHFDLRFLVRADGDLTPKMSAESKDLRWFTLEEATGLTHEASMQRQFAKLALLRQL